MPTPRLIRPFTAIIEAIDKSSTVYDRRSRQPIGDVARVRYSIPAQHDSVHRMMPDWDQSGPSEQLRGRLIVRYVDIEAAGYTPRRGDKVVQMGTKSVEYYIVNIEQRGHWQNGPTFLRLYYSDRRPGANEPNFG